MSDFSKNKIKDYKYWTIFIHDNQSYSGRCIIWCKRSRAVDLADANLDELKELTIILKELKQTIHKIFEADWFNYSFLGNATKHLHMHFVPRYESSRQFENVIFKDARHGHNYLTDHSFKISEELLQKIKNKIIKIS